MRIAILMEATRASGPARNLLYALELLRDECEFRFFTFRRPGDGRSEFVSVLEAERYVVEVIEEAGPYDPRAAVRLWRRLAEMNPDIIQVHNTKSRLFTLAGAAVGRLDRQKLLFFFHGETWVDAKQRLYNWVDRFTFKWANRTAVVSRHQVRLLTAWGVPEWRISLVPNVIPIVEPVSERIGGLPIIMTAGRLSYEKGLDVLIDALGILNSQRAGRFKARIYGEGPELPKLREQVHRLLLAEVVDFRGHVAALDSEYLEAGLFVLPSRSEGLPNVLLEAAIHRIPIVATSVGGIPDLMTDPQEIVLVQPGDAIALASAMSRFLDSSDGWKSMACAAYVRIRNERSPNAKAIAMMRCWQSIHRDEND